MNPIGSLSVVLLSAYDGAILLVAMNRFGDAMYPAITRRLFNLSCLAGGLSLTGGAGANTCSATVPRHSACIPPSGSQMLIAAKVSP